MNSFLRWSLPGINSPGYPSWRTTDKGGLCSHSQTCHIFLSLLKTDSVRKMKYCKTSLSHRESNRTSLAIGLQTASVTVSDSLFHVHSWETLQKAQVLHWEWLQISSSFHQTFTPLSKPSISATKSVYCFIKNEVAHLPLCKELHHVWRLLQVSTGTSRTFWAQNWSWKDSQTARF